MTTPSHPTKNQDDTKDDSSYDEPIKWFPLESNPELLNVYLQKLGLNTNEVALQDVYSTEDWALAMIPRPVYAVVLLYPLTEKLKARDYAVGGGDASTSTTGATAMTAAASTDDLIYIPQRIGNACGTMALLHATLNATRPFMLADSWLEQFYSQVAPLEPFDRAQQLEQDVTLAKLHEEATRSRQNSTTREQSVDDYANLDTHFVTFVCSNDNRLVELDGRKAVGGGPVDCGVSCSPDSLLETACQYIQSSIMPVDPSEMRFTILALAAAASHDN